MANSVNPDLQKERNGATFDPEILSGILHEGKEKLARRRYLRDLIEKDPAFKGRNTYFLSRDEIYQEGVRRASLLSKKTQQLGITSDEDRYTVTNAAFPNESPPTTLHYGMFIPTLIGQGTDEQIAKWLPAAERYEILGTYAQTELGHGTFLRGLETTATYDGQRDEFVINSPTQTSYKWWPGGLGKTSNYAIVMAVMFINGKNYGPHPFMVQLRDLKTHYPLPGVTSGDIGPKFQFTMIDNGYLKLDNVRVPRENLLMRFAQVLRDGSYIKAKHAKLAYGTMIYVRATMVYSVVSDFLAQAATIAIRYSCVRRQSELKPGQEVQVLDFVTQQMRLFPKIAMAYAFKFAGFHMREMYTMVTDEISAGNVDALPELHSLSSGLKAYTTYQGSVGLEECRLCCGGHGYADYSGLPKKYGLQVASCTYEGENYVMYLQCARYLLKCVQRTFSGAKLGGTVAYLSENCPPCSINQQVSLNSLVSAYKHRAKRLVMRAAENMSRLLSQGLDQHDAWNQAHPYLVKAAQVHVQLYVLQAFADKLTSIQDANVAVVLEKLAVLYGLQDIIDQSGDFFEDGYMTSQQLQYGQQKFSSLLTELRPNAVALVDAFDFSDQYLGSALGCYDGNVYERIIKFAKESPLNKQEVHPAITKYFKSPRGPSAKL